MRCKSPANSQLQGCRCLMLIVDFVSVKIQVTYLLPDLLHKGLLLLFQEKVGRPSSPPGCDLLGYAVRYVYKVVRSTTYTL